MHFPSITQLTERAGSVLRRFPWTLALAAFAAFAGIYDEADNLRDPLVRAAFVAALGIPLSIALALLGEARGWDATRRALLQVGGLALLGVFYLLWPGMVDEADVIRYFQLSAFVHLLVAFLPFMRGPETRGFWRYNSTMFGGIIRAAIFGGVLYLGTVIALAALERLFEVDLYNGIYFDLWLIMGLVVTTWIFLAAAPKSFAELEEGAGYPRPLKLFAQYVLTPLSGAYLLILLAYLVKILIVGEWPSGWIGWLVASVAVTGMLGFLLVHPLRSDPDEGWIRIYSRWLFIGLVPASIMLVVAFWKRIAPFGLTEPRILGLLLGLWLLGIALYFAMKREAAIRVIPISLAGILLATLAGPLSLTQVSVRSQRDRLVGLLAGADTSESRTREASGALRFLLERRNADAVMDVFGVAVTLPPAEERSGRGSIDSLATTLLAGKGVQYDRRAWVPREEGFFSFSADPQFAKNVTGYTWSVAMNSGDSTTRLAGEGTVRLLTSGSPDSAVIAFGSDTLRFAFAALVDSLMTEPTSWDGIPDRPRSLSAVTGPIRAELLLQRLSARTTPEGRHVTDWGGTLLIGPRP